MIDQLSRLVYLLSLYGADIFFLGFFLILNAHYAMLIGLSARDMAWRKAASLPELDTGVLSDRSTPPIAILAPAYNEASTILSSVRSFLQLEYPDLQVIIINDGSEDETMALLIEAFDMHPAELLFRPILKTQAVRKIYRSPQDPRLIVVDKVNGGKADALNVGLNICRAPLVCCLDSDTLIERRALLRMVEPFLYEDEPVVAVGGSVRVANSCKIKDGVVEEIRLPSSWWARFQVVEYTRSFAFGRSGFNALGGPLIISGAFGLFLHRAVEDAGGYLHDTVGEDMELVVRLHRWVRSDGRTGKIIHLSEPECYTEVPESYAVLSRQRDRWHRGLADSMYRHREMFFNRKFSKTGMVSYPMFFFFELVGPLFEGAGYLWFAYLTFTGCLNTSFAILFFCTAYLLGAMINIQSLLTDQFVRGAYRRPADQFFLLVAALAEGLGYRQLTLMFRLKGLLSYFRGDRSWGEMTRQGFAAPEVP